MITSFFAPKKKSGGGGSKRPHKDESGDDDAVTKKRVITPADSTVSSSSSSSISKSKLTDETSTLLSYLHSHDDANTTWRGVLEKHFTTSNFTSLATFIAKERYVVFWCMHHTYCDGAPSCYLHYLQPIYLTYIFYYMLSRTSKTVYPPPQLVFSSLNLTPLHKVKGKFCYH